MNTEVIKVALLDDYHGVAERYADWTTLGPQVQVQSFRDYLPEGERAGALQPFDVIVAMRERTPFPAQLIEALPRMRLLVTTGLRTLASTEERRGGKEGAGTCRFRGVPVH